MNEVKQNKTDAKKTTPSFSHSVWIECNLHYLWQPKIFTSDTRYQPFDEIHMQTYIEHVRKFQSG